MNTNLGTRVSVLFAAGLATAGLVLGAMLLAVCAAVTVFNFCIPSALMALWAHRRPREVRPA